MMEKRKGEAERCAGDLCGSARLGQQRHDQVAHPPGGDAEAEIPAEEGGPTVGTPEYGLLGVVLRDGSNPPHPCEKGPVGRKDPGQEQEDRKAEKTGMGEKHPPEHRGDKPIRPLMVKEPIQRGAIGRWWRRERSRHFARQRRGRGGIGLRTAAEQWRAAVRPRGMLGSGWCGLSWSPPLGGTLAVLRILEVEAAVFAVAASVHSAPQGSAGSRSSCSRDRSECSGCLDE